MAKQSTKTGLRGFSVLNCAHSENLRDGTVCTKCGAKNMPSAVAVEFTPKRMTPAEFSDAMDFYG